MFPTGTAFAADHHVGAGGAQALIDSGVLKGGDRLILGPGFHGSIVIDELMFDEPVVVIPESDTLSQLDHLLIRNSAGWRFERVSIITREDKMPSADLVGVFESRNIHLHDLTIASAPDSEGWTAEEWRQLARNGIVISGSDVSITNNSIRNVRHGITSTAKNAWVEGNTIELFSGDGIRALGDDSAYIGNSIETCVQVDDNHDDGIQSWSLDAEGRPGRGVVRNVRVEGNLIVNGDHPLTCTLQGIGLFDGIFENWTIRDNRVVVDHWHGITVMGARNVAIFDNTVLDSRPGAPGAPWISITAHKDGRVSQNSVIARNVTLPFSGGSSSPFRQPQPGVTRFGNRVLDRVQE